MSDDQSSGETPPKDGDGQRRRRRRRRRPREGPVAPAGDRSATPDPDGARGVEREAAPAADGADRGESGPRKPRRRRGGEGGRRPERDARDSSGAPSPAPRRERAAAPPPTAAPAAPTDVDLGWDDDAPPAPVAARAPISTPPGAEEWEPDEVDSSITYGDDGDAPTPDVVLGADLPAAEADRDDVDPVSRCVFDEDQAPSQPVHNIVGVKFASAGRIYSYDGGEGRYARGDEVLVESDRGPRIGIVATSSTRRPHGGTRLKRVLRHPDKNDRRTLGRNAEKEAETLAAARDAARALGLPIKVFRAEVPHAGPNKTKARIYFTSEDRVDFRDLVRDLSRTLHLRVEMRQTGVRDQAKMVGGIGSCGMELCCSTWLPEFVPVSIKNAKDQGLVLNPSKVSGQCGRLKCCLVYEQETYAALRKGLPKLGKRVITEVGEGRVVEVDVLRQRVRVSHPGGEVAVFGKDEVKPMFPSQQPTSTKPRTRSDRRPEPQPDPSDDPPRDSDPEV